MAQRRYAPPDTPRLFLREIDEGVERLNGEIEAADARREKDEKARKDWLANITHDLKTPLSPVRGQLHKAHPVHPGRNPVPGNPQKRHAQGVLRRNRRRVCRAWRRQS